jgi:hypothetical protein
MRRAKNQHEAAEAKCCSETSSDFQLASRRYIREDRTPHRDVVQNTEMNTTLIDFLSC